MEQTSLAVKEAANSTNNLEKKKREMISFLWGFREYFETKFLYLQDEVTGAQIEINGEFAV